MTVAPAPPPPTAGFSPEVSLDPLLPVQIAAKAEDIGVSKAKWATSWAAPSSSVPSTGWSTCAASSSRRSVGHRR